MTTNENEIKEEIAYWLQQENYSMAELKDLIQYRTILPEPRHSDMEVREVIWKMVLTGELSMDEKRKIHLEGDKT